MTRYEFARLIAKTFKKDEELVQRSSVIFPSDEKKESNSFSFKMDTYNVETFLNLKMPSVEESLQLTYKRLSV